MRRRFTIFELSIVLLSLGVLAMIAVPDVTIRDREVGEAAAVRTLVRLAVEEYAGTRGEARTPPATLVDLLGRAGIRASADPQDGVVTIGAYRFALYVPGPEGGPVAATGESAPTDPAFLLLAWPTRPGETGERTYGVDESLVVHEDPETGRDGAPPPIPFHRLEPAASRSWPLPWRPLLPHQLPAEVRASLRERDLPVPALLDELAGE